MATHEIDQRLLGQLAASVGPSHPAVSAALYQILGLSILLSRRLARARDIWASGRNVRALDLYHHIIWLAREGLALADAHVCPFANQFVQKDPQLNVFAEKLRATFYHIFCMFDGDHAPSPSMSSGQLSYKHAPVSARQDTGAGGRGERQPGAQEHADEGQAQRDPAQEAHETSADGHPSATLREDMPSQVSDASYLTNPYATPPTTLSPSAAPLLPYHALDTTAADPTQAPLLLPDGDLLSAASHAFDSATLLARRLLPGSAPLRLSLALDHATFLWECARERNESRAVAREAVADVYAAPEGMDDGEFEDASVLVEALGRAMRRRSGQRSEEGDAGVVIGGGGSGMEWVRGGMAMI